MKTIKITLSLAELKDHGACEEGVEVFLALCKSQGSTDTLSIDWDAEAYLKAAVEHRDWIGWLLEEKILPLWDLSFMVLDKRNLAGAILDGVSLRSASLSCSNLRGANLSLANLRSANMSYADLSYANLYGANLYGADLTGVRLHGADLCCADLYGAYYPTGDVPDGWRRGAFGRLIQDIKGESK